MTLLAVYGIRHKLQSILFDTLEIHSFTKEIFHPKKVYGQLVLLGFDVTVFTPAAYQRHSL